MPKTPGRRQLKYLKIKRTWLKRQLEGKTDKTGIRLMEGKLMYIEQDIKFLTSKCHVCDEKRYDCVC